MTRARELARLGNSDVLTVDSNQNVGVGSETPDRKFDVGTGDLIVGAAITLGGNSGIISATKFSGGWDGTLSIDDSTTSTSQTTGALVITGGVGIAKSLFVGEGISVGGTITYDDVTNIDSVGFVTAGKGFRATTGGIVVTAGVSTLSGGVNVNTGNVKVAAGIVTVGAGVTISSDFIHLTDNSKINLGIASDFQIYHSGSDSYIVNSTGNLVIRAKPGETGIEVKPDGAVELRYDNSKVFETVSAGASVYGALKLQNGLLRENIKITAGKLSANLTINVDNGMLHYFTTQESAQSIPNIISGAGINTDMAIGDTMTVSVLATAHANSFPTNWRIDGVEASAGVTTYWNGGSAPTAGSSSGVDFYTLNFVKTASARYTAFANVSNFA